MRQRILVLCFVIFGAACGAAEPRAEASYETHTTAADDEMSDSEDADAESGSD